MSFNLKAHAHRCLQLAGGTCEVGGSKRGIGGTPNAIAKLTGNGAEKVRGSVHLVDALYVAVIEQIEPLNGRLQREMVREMKHPLQAYVAVIIRRAAIGVASDGAE